MTEGKSSKKSAKSLLALNPKEDAEFQKKVQQVKKRPNTAHSLTPGVIYVGHLPRGLLEPQLRGYFQQFGKVLRLRISRSKKTGGSKGYGFVEFECDEVAKIVAETMDNYLMGERLIKCHVMPPEKVHEKLFDGSQRGFKRPRQPAVARYNKEHAPKDVEKMTAKLLSKEAKLRKRLAEKGIDYVFPGFASQVPAKKVQSQADVSLCREDVTPVCTPSMLERRKSIRAEDDDVDEEIIIKAKSVPENREDVEESEEDTEEEGDVDVVDDEEEEGEEHAV